MGIKEIFSFPTVKQVIFQIRYPNLFIIENKIGEIQLRIMDRFTDSKLLHRRQVVFADIGPDGKLENIPQELDQTLSKRIWQFICEDKYNLNITSNSLAIISNIHKSYNKGDDEKFRDIISYVLDNFFKVINISIINRIGLRYIDEMPIFDKNNDNINLYYKSTFDIDRFKFEDSSEMFFRAVTKRGDYQLIYMEQLKQDEGEWKLIMDFDTFALKKRVDECLGVTDELHEICTIEYEDRITEKFKEYMRTGEK